MTAAPERPTVSGSFAGTAGGLVMGNTRIEPSSMVCGVVGPSAPSALDRCTMALVLATMIEPGAEAPFWKEGTN